MKKANLKNDIDKKKKMYQKLLLLHYLLYFMLENANVFAKII